MFKIVRFPSRLEHFFRNLRDRFHWEHFEYFRSLVVLVTCAWGRRNISAAKSGIIWYPAGGNSQIN